MKLNIAPFTLATIFIHTSPTFSQVKNLQSGPIIDLPLDGSTVDFFPDIDYEFTEFGCISDLSKQFNEHNSKCEKMWYTERSHLYQTTVMLCRCHYILGTELVDLSLVSEPDFISSPNYNSNYNSRATDEEIERLIPQEDLYNANFIDDYYAYDDIDELVSINDKTRCRDIYNKIGFCKLFKRCHFKKVKKIRKDCEETCENLKTMEYNVGTCDPEPFTLKENGANSQLCRKKIKKWDLVDECVDINVRSGYY